MNSEETVLNLLNSFFEQFPINLVDFNHKYFELDQMNLIKFEKINPKFGLCRHPIEVDKYGISTFSMIATITDCLIDKRLAFRIDEDTRRIVGVVFLEVEDK